jgi:flagellar biosynthesis protein FlhF
MQSRERTYTAKSLDAALARIKRELGADAVILSTRRVAGADPDAQVEVRAAPANEAPAATSERPPPDDLVYRLLVRSRIDESLARWLAEAGPRARTLTEARGAVAKALATHVVFTLPQFAAARRVVAFVGPTGVGKTTTLAKVAAELALVAGRSLGIVSLDGYRVGAAAQIEELADLIGVPLVVARDRASFARALERLRDAEVVLVDTAGRAPRDASALAELSDCLHGAEEPVDVCLCVTASTRSPELDDVIGRHAVLRPTHLVVTKNDEAMTHDGVLSACIASGLPLAWLTTGQRVPEDIAPATPERLASALCGEETYR